MGREAPGRQPAGRGCAVCQGQAAAWGPGTRLLSLHLLSGSRFEATCRREAAVLRQGAAVVRILASLHWATGLETPQSTDSTFLPPLTSHTCDGSIPRST